MKQFWIQQIREFVSKPVVITVAIHWTLVVIAFLDRGGFGFPFHFYYESTLLKIITLLDFPSLMAAEGLGFTISVVISETAIANILGTVFIVTLQWVTIGYAISKILSRGSRTDATANSNVDKRKNTLDYWSIFKSELLNKPVIITVASHWALVVIAFLFRGGFRSPINFDSESILLNTAFYLDLPALTTAGLLGFELELSISDNDISTIVGTVFIVTLLWVLVGYLISKIGTLAKRTDAVNTGHFD